MQTLTPAPPARSRRRRRLSGGLIAALLAAGLIAALTLLLIVSAPARARADTFLAVFRTGQRGTLDIIDIALPTPPGVDPAQLGALVRLDLPAGQEVPDRGEVHGYVDFNVRSFRRPQAPRSFVYLDQTITATFDRAAFERALGPLAAAGFRLPPELSTPIEGRVASGVRFTWPEAGGDLTLWIGRNPRLYTSSGPSWEELRSRLTQLLQIAAPETAAKLAAVRDWNNTVLVPVPPGATSRRVRADSTENALLIERPGRSLLIWQRYGVVHVLDGPLNGRALVALADTLR